MICHPIHPIQQRSMKVSLSFVRSFVHQLILSISLIIIVLGQSESVTPNDLLSFSPPLVRRSVPTKRPKLSSTNISVDSSKTLSIAPADLLSPNHQTVTSDEGNLLSQGKQARKLDPRTCAECGKTLFSDKTHLTHCQTHAKNEKQCWICGVHDDDIKKHILTEHANQKFTSAGFKVRQ